MIVRGPYRHSNGRLKGRAYVNIITDDGKRTTQLYSRYLMEQHLGRKLEPDETVDHINEDSTDDRLENLQVLSRSENAKKTAKLRRTTEMVSFTCPECGQQADKKARFVRHAKNQGKSGPFCGRSCAGKASRRKQLGV